MTRSNQTTEATSDSIREPMPMESSGPCWICGGTGFDRVWVSSFDLTPLLRFGPALAHADHPALTLVRCRNCGFGQPETVPAKADYFETLYDIPYSEDDMNSMFAETAKTWISQTVLDGVAKRLPANMPRTLLDVGCHVGQFLSFAHRAGWQTEGAELGKRTGDFAARRTGLTVHRGPAQDMIDQGNRYAAVTITDVLEHIPHPAPLVRQPRELLLPGGVLAVKVPHGPMQRFKERIRRDLLRDHDAGQVMTRLVHINHFTVRSLRYVLEAAGFQNVVITVGVPEIFPVSPQRSPAKSWISGLGRKAVYYTAKVLPGGVHTPLALNLQAYAVNPS